MKEQIKKILDGFAHQYYNIIQAVNNGYTVAFTRIGTDTYADQITALCEAGYQKRIDTMFNPDYLDFKKGVEAGREIERQECQARVEELFEEIEENMDGLCVYTEEYGEMHCCIVNPEKIKPAKLIFDTKVWQAIKKEYLKEGVDVS